MKVLGKYKNKNGQIITDRVIGLPESRYTYLISLVAEYRKYNHGYYAMELRHLKREINDKEISQIQEDYSPKQIEELIDSSLTQEDIELLQYIPKVKIEGDVKDSKSVLTINTLPDGTIVARNMGILDEDIKKFISTFDYNIVNAKIHAQRVSKKNEDGMGTQEGR